MCTVLDLHLLQVPVIEVIEDEKAVRKSPPDSDRNKERYRDVSLSMAPLPIPLGPLGFGGKLTAPKTISIAQSGSLSNEYLRYKNWCRKQTSDIYISIVECFPC